MKKFLAVALLILMPMLACAEGKLILEPSLDFDSHKWGTSGGLSVWEPVWGPLSFSGWLGARFQEEEMDHLMLRTGFGIQPLEAFRIEAGHKYQYNYETEKDSYGFYVRTTVTVW